MEALGLTEALGVAGHCGIAPPVALLLEEVKNLQGVMAAPVPMPQEEVFVGVKDARPASFVGALRKGRAPEIATHGRLGDPQLLRNGLACPALPPQRPDLFMACQASAPAVGGLHLRGA